MSKRTIWLGQGMIRPGCYDPGGQREIDDTPALQPAYAIDDVRYRAPINHTHSVKSLPELWSHAATQAAEDRLDLHRQLDARSTGLCHAQAQYNQYMLQMKASMHRCNVQNYASMMQLQSAPSPCNICTRTGLHTHTKIEALEAGW